MTIKLVAFDIGGVLADIDKTPISNYLNRHNLAIHHIFNNKFIALQNGFLTPRQFILAACHQFSLKQEEFFYHFTHMIKPKPIAFKLKYLTLPHLFFSNINALHFNYFINCINAPKKSCEASILSFKENIHKPDEKFFNLLIKKTNMLAHEILVIDDKAVVIERALSYGFKGLMASDNQPFDFLFAK